MKFRIERLACLCMIAMMVFCSVTHGFNLSCAITYANRFVSEPYSPPYPDFPNTETGGDAANFIIQILHAGCYHIFPAAARVFTCPEAGNK